MPTCPKCNNDIDLNQLASATNRTREEDRQTGEHLNKGQ